MKIKKQKHTKAPLVIIAIIIALSAASYAFIAHKKSLWPFPPQQSQNTDAQQDTINESPKNSNSVKKDEAGAAVNDGKTTDQVPINKDLVATITQLEQLDDTVKFSATIENSTSAGTCVVTFTNPNDRPVTKQFDATIKDGVTLCKSSDIPSLEFSYLGAWSVSFRYYVGGEQITATGEVTIQ